MSQYSPELIAADNEKGIRSGWDVVGAWPDSGKWQDRAHFTDLKTFAEALYVPESAAGADLLNSIPTPWARLLLFESALHDVHHPAHDEVTKQWRGLLGVLALADCLGLDVTPVPFSLEQTGQSSVIQTFAELRPKDYKRSNKGTVEPVEGNWSRFWTLAVDQAVLGATSPRTLVFSGVAHQCPASIPFRSKEGRLADPVTFYEQLRDATTLRLLGEWIHGLEESLGPDPEWFGITPGAVANADVRRGELLVKRLAEWEEDAQKALRRIAAVAPESRAPRRSTESKEPAGVEAGLESISYEEFSEYPYELIHKIKRTEAHESDLLIQRPKGAKFLVGFNRQRGSDVLDQKNQPFRGTLRVWDHRTLEASQFEGEIPFPSETQMKDYEVIKDPRAELFEDTLIQVNLPQNPRWAYELRFGNNTFLFPFKQRIFDLLSEKEIFENTTLTNLSSSAARVELKIPLASGKRIRVYKDFIKTDIITERTPGIAVWPDFTHDSWNGYFYFITRAAPRQVEMAPLEGGTGRGTEHDKWYRTERPLKAFIGTIDGKSGLLLLKRPDLEGDLSNPPAKRWKVAVDFGSTHTRAFRVEVGQDLHDYKPDDIKPIIFRTLSQEITVCMPDTLRQNFFPLEGQLRPTEREELKTLMMKPELNPGSPNTAWLPREGYIYSHWLHLGNYEADHLRHELKWSAQANQDELYAFLYCLVTMIKAEALKQGARVLFMRHAFPSVLTPNLRTTHTQQWRSATGQTASLLTLPPDPTQFGPEETRALTEAVAVCQYLTWDEKAEVGLNTISLDVGGSTSDFAVWAGNKLQVQESIKLAADVLGRFVQSQGGRNFCEWLARTLSEPYYGSVQLGLDGLAVKPSGFSLMFSNLLTALELQKRKADGSTSSSLLDDLIDRIRTAEEAKSLRAILYFLFASVFYYAGLLARKVSLGGGQVHLYVCGKGGKLLTWLNNGEKMAQEMFKAGFGRSDVEVYTRTSAKAKEEVGRGLLALAGLEDLRQGPDPEATSEAYPVTVGESGYKLRPKRDGVPVELKWNDELTEELVKQLADEVPSLDSLSELGNFLKHFRESPATKGAAELLGISEGVPGQFWSKLHGRFFNQAQGCIVYDAKQKRTLLEPFFITEIKVLAGFLNPPVNLYD